ncbi:MAG: PAS domain-containing protein [Bacteroidota bacterium]
MHANPTEDKTFDLIHRASDPTFVFDVSTEVFVDMNIPAVAFLGYSKGELRQMGIKDISPSLIRGRTVHEIAAERIQEALEGGNPVYDWIHIHQSGEEIPCEVRLIRVPPYERPLVRATLIDKRNWKLQPERRESEERLLLAMKATGLGTYDWYPEENRIFWDERMHEIFHLAPSSTVDRNAYFLSIMHPDEREAMVKFLTEGLFEDQDTQFFDDPYRVILNGKIHHMRTIGMVLRNSQQKIYRVIGTVQDQTAQIEAAQTAEAFQARWKSIAENPFDWLMIIDPSGTFQYVNRTAPPFDKEDVIGKMTVFDCIDPSQQEYVRDELSFVFASGKAGYYESFFPGLNQWTANYIGPILKDGKVTHVSIMTRNITNQRNIEQHLRETDWILKQAQRITQLGGWDWNIQTGEVKWTPEMFEIYGMDPQGPPLSPDQFLDDIHPEDKELVKKAISEATEEMRPYQSSHRIVRRSDQSIRHIRAFGETFYDENGKQNRLIGTIQDFTEVLESQIRYQTFFEDNISAVFWIEMKKAIPTDLPAQEQAQLIFKNAYVKDCSNRAAQMYGLSSKEEVIGGHIAKAWHLETKEELQAFLALTETFIESGYSWENMLTEEKNVAGETKRFHNSMKGVVENGNLVRIWGSLLDVSTLFPIATQTKLADVQKTHILKILEAVNWKIEGKDGAAQVLDLKPSTLRDKMKKLDIRRKS